MERKNKIIALIGFLVVFILASLHTFFLSKDLFGHGYYIFREISVTFLSLGLCIYNIQQAIKHPKHFTAHLVLANAFAIIATVHILKFFFTGATAYGGLLC